MKRFLILFCTFIVCFSLLVVPTLALEVQPVPDVYFPEYDNAISSNTIVGHSFKFGFILYGYYIVDLSFQDFETGALDTFMRTGLFYFDGNAEWSERDDDAESTIKLTYANGSFLLASYYDDGTVEYFASEGDNDLVMRLIPCRVPTDDNDTPDTTFDDIGEFFTYCMSCLADVALLIVSSPALLILSIGFILIIFVVVVVKRF